MPAYGQKKARQNDQAYELYFVMSGHFARKLSVSAGRHDRHLRKFRLCPDQFSGPAIAVGVELAIAPPTPPEELQTVTTSIDSMGEIQ